MPTSDGFQGVSNCYVFKSRLQEYAQKVGVSTPVYETTKEGPSHEPFFKSTVIVNDVRYDSLPGFSNRKAAEQSAAEVALRDLAKSGGVNQCISQPVHETGLCKNLLQEYAQKMNYAIPLYQCQKDENPGKVPLFSCSIEIGGIRYIGAASRTKKEAEIKAARTALLAIQSSASESYNKHMGNAELTVLPCKKRGVESVVNVEETPIVPRMKKPRPNKRTFKKKFFGIRANQVQFENAGEFNFKMDHNREQSEKETDAFVLGSNQPATEAMVNSQDGMHQTHQSKLEKAAVEGSIVPAVDLDLENGQSTVLVSNQSNNGILPPMLFGDSNLSMDLNEVSGVRDVDFHSLRNSTMAELEPPSVTVGLNHSEQNL